MSETTQSTALGALIEKIRGYVKDARAGLPQEVFLFISGLTPMVNVDLLVKDEAGRTLLTWRADSFYGPGWHVPGGVIRFKEYASTRVKEVARAELGATVEVDQHPLLVREVMATTRDVRGHFISLIYGCRLLSPPNPANESLNGTPAHGQWKWHAGCPDNLIRQHEMYRGLIDGSAIPSSAAHHWRSPA